MKNRPNFWNKETQDIDDYWYHRVSAFAYSLIGGTSLIYQANQFLKGKPIAEDGVNPVIIAVSGYLVYRGIEEAKRVISEQREI